MLSLFALAAQSAPLYWEDLGLRPYLFEIGSFQLRYYSLAYLLGIILGYWHLTKMIKAPGAPMGKRHAEDLFFYCTLGIILGGRLGYSIFYMPSMWENPVEVFKLWHGGMSFHGGVIGVLIAIGWVSWRGKLDFLRVADYIAVNVPFGYMLGRIANFINGELWGRPSDVPWAMVFPAADELPRHPSQLYQAGTGLVLTVVLLWLFWKTRARYRRGLLVGIFTVGMGVGRFVNEFFREPDPQLAEFAERTGLSMGQWLTIPLIVLGLAVMLYALTRPETGVGSAKPAAPKA